MEERDGRVCCVGQVNLSGHLLVTNGGHGAQAAMGLLVLVEGPGRLRAREIDLDVQVQDGTVRRNQSIYEGQLATSWLEELREKSWQKCHAAENGLRKESHTYGWNTVVVAAWAEVITTIARMAHGGAVVVLPDSTPLVTIKHPTIPISYLDEVNAYLCLSSIVNQADPHDPARLVALDARHARVFSYARSVAHLAAIDGCVVLDRELRLQGYGGKIAADEAARASKITFADVQTKLLREESEIFNRFGQRHRSAFYLCKCCPHALAFVLSQDGALRVFGSDATHVYLEEDINPQQW